MPETVKRLDSQIKTLLNKNKDLYKKVWTTKGKANRETIRAEMKRNSNRVRVLTEKRNKLSKKQTRERLAKKGKK